MEEKRVGRKNQGEHGRPARVDTDFRFKCRRLFPSRPARAREGSPEGGRSPLDFWAVGNPAAAKVQERPVSVSERDVEPVEIHDLGPCRHKILYEFCFGVGGSIDFRQGSQLRV